MKRFSIFWFFTLIFLASSVWAGNSLPANQAAFGGTFETSDAYGAASCVSRNGLTFSCTCPGGTQPISVMRVINDVNGAGTQAGGNVWMCSAGGATSGSTDYYGAYQVDDVAGGGTSCRVTNNLTNSCSCPSGTVSARMSTVVDNAGFKTSSIYYCMVPKSNPTNFGGAYQKDDTGACRTANPFTNACSCPSNFSATATRTEVLYGSTFGGSNIYTCLPPAQSVTLCSTSTGAKTIDPTGRIDSSGSIQACADATTTNVLEIPAGTYLVANPILMKDGLSLRTKLVADTDAPCSNGVPCATLVASSNFSAQYGFVQGHSRAANSNLTLDHVILDGNRWDRLSSPNAGLCVSQGNAGPAYGENTDFVNCDHCKLSSSVAKNALCGTGFSISGSYLTVVKNIFRDNGDHSSPSLWADGLTTTMQQAATVTNNQFIDNSDVGAIFAEGQNVNFSNNSIVQAKQRAFAGLMWHSFDENPTSRAPDFTGAQFSNNTINCGDYCFFAVQIGPRPWTTATPNVIGGTFSGNTIYGGIFGINLNGIGTSGNPTTFTVISSNTVSGTYGKKYTCGNGASVVGAARAKSASNTWTAGTDETTTVETDHCVTTAPGTPTFF